MATEQDKGQKDGSSTVIHPPKDDERGDAKPGFGGEGARSELGDGTQPIDEDVRRRIAEQNRAREAGRERSKR